MNRIRASIALTLVVGLLAAVPALAQTATQPSATPATGGPAYLRLLVTINQLGLSQTQMREIHDILAGILTKVKAIRSDRDAFAQEMLKFNGTQDELDALLFAFQEKMNRVATALEGAVTQAVKEISGILTIEQGQIIKQAFPGFQIGQAGRGSWMMGRTGSPAATQNQARQNAAGNPFQTLAQRLQNQRNTAQSGPSGWWCPVGLGNQVQSGSGTPQAFGMGTGKGVRGPVGNVRGSMTYGFAGKRLSFLQEIVDILQAKLTAGS